MTRLEYIKKFQRTALEAVKGTRLFPSVMMAQAILESSDKQGIPGNSILARVYHNHFGIKADKHWPGKKVNLKTREVLAGKEVMLGDFFRVYEDPIESFKDRVQFLLKNKRYTLGGVFLAPTAEEQAVALQRAGYATDPVYAKILIALIRKYELYTLETEFG